ncbi:MAG: hypothetical protein IJ004_03560 [Clostridia bacterium]|nr:hypothetical protein [Clostridia bacterium]
MNNRLEKEDMQYVFCTLKVMSIAMILGCLFVIELFLCPNTRFEQLYVLPMKDQIIEQLLTSGFIYLGCGAYILFRLLFCAN